MGNIGSILNMYKKIGVKTEVISTEKEILGATKILLPGVGAFDAAMTRINELGIKSALDQKALKEKIPVLGICLGMQLLTESSEEGKLSGLSWIKAKTLSFKDRVDTKKYKVPHMGWNSVLFSNDSLLSSRLKIMDDVRFYFVHSYFVKCDDLKNSIMQSDYGLRFDSAIQNENIYGAQFHPEKSHKFGMTLLENFARI